jgi:hypothetical protein
MEGLRVGVRYLSVDADLPGSMLLQLMGWTSVIPAYPLISLTLKAGTRTWGVYVFLDTVLGKTSTATSTTEERTQDPASSVVELAAKTRPVRDSF